MRARVRRVTPRSIYFPNLLKTHRETSEKWYNLRKRRAMLVKDKGKAINRIVSLMVRNKITPAKIHKELIMGHRIFKITPLDRIDDIIADNHLDTEADWKVLVDAYTAAKKKKS